MRRLSIIDLQTGHQPVCNEDGSIWLVLNGEIYNFQELRAELSRQGHVFATATDTEVIVHLYEEMGDRCVERLRGMFAFALWDERRRRLLIARDRIGIKPLYYGTVNGRFLFGSELKAILQLREVDRHVSWRALDHVLAYKTTPEDESIITGIRKLKPGHRLALAVGENEPQIERYWSVSFEPETGRSEDDVAEELRMRLMESVRLHMVSDVPVGAFLSGGTDSSAVVAAMSAVGAGRIKTFSIGFRDKGFNELPFARAVADRLGTDHHELVLDPDVMEILTNMAWDLDEPFGDSSAIPTYMVSKLAAEHVKVVLSGDGGDELFAGYTEYVVESRERRARFLPSSARWALGAVSSLMPDGAKGKNWLHHFSLPGPERYLDAVTMFKRPDRLRLLTPDARAAVETSETERSRIERLSTSTGHWLSTLQTMDFDHYLPLDILTKVDRMSMAHSLEARVPLLDHEFVEFAARIPVEMKLKNGRTKHIFVRAVRGLLPDRVLDRPKQGFAVPVGSWFRRQLGPLVRDTILSETFRRRGMFDGPVIEALVRRHERGRPLDPHLWTLISIELWCRTFLDGKHLPIPAPVKPRTTADPKIMARRSPMVSQA
jgi:asparagine synthase (glutamine-hydrolysing)